MAGMMGEGDAPRRARVLVVDDERPMRRLLHVVLEGEGYEVFEAEGVRSAIHAAAALRPDLILLTWACRMRIFYAFLTYIRVEC